MGLRDLFTTARLVSLLVMASATPCVEQTPDLSVPSAHDWSSISSKVSELSSFMDRIYLKLATMEAKMNDTDRLDVKLETMELKIESLEAKINNINRLDVKLKTMAAKINKTDRFDVKLKTMELKIESLEATINSIDRLDVNLETMEAKKNSIDQLDGTLETIEAKIQSLEDSLENQIAGTKKEMGEMMTGITNLTDKIKEEFLFIKDEAENSWQKLQLNTEESASKTLNAFQSVAKNLNNTILGKVKSAFIDLFSLKSCKKNGTALYPSSAQYTVIYNSEIIGLETPLLCDTVTDGGGWIVIQRRYTGKVDFYRNWASYKAGFGSVDNEFWLGNDNIHTITSTGKYELRVDLKYKGQSKFANYGKFSIDGEEEKYKLHVGSYSGTAGDSLTRVHNGQKFSTFDQDNDTGPDFHCARERYGAWWYKNCLLSNLNGLWGDRDVKGLRWYYTTGVDSVEFSEMKIRRLNE
ncbi:hypothetical protein EGW08_014717 [Elysia chlorotica]|uniref:Fibrinogen C-terminal domain-containing protein n=1 Tax=Elysia chlorotica TaxID=188477 RepID=A0A3S0ZLC2_ELYCH|nr:hypothetical protein EGW08_014717 [Elysia chlorotica]